MMTQGSQRNKQVFFLKEYQNYSYKYKLSTEETRWG